MQEVDASGLKAFEERLDGVLKEMPAMRRKLHEEIGRQMQSVVRGKIDVGTHGTIKRWQEVYVGSGGGYAAVRAIDGKGVKGYDDSPGAITNYWELGFRPGGGRNLVGGRFFYRRSADEAENAAAAKAREMIDEITKKIGG